MLLRATACHDEVAFGTKAKLPQPRQRRPRNTTLGYLLPIITQFFTQSPSTRPLTAPALTTNPIVTTDRQTS